VSGQLDGRVALVTGAGAGIGEGIARRFTDEGARVAVAELDEDASRSVAAKIGGLFVRTDVSDRTQVESPIAAAVSEYGSIDVLVNNAWVGGAIGRVESKTDDIAPVAVFLASDGARYLTGNTLFVDGGGHVNGVAWTPDLDTGS
jgi:NAD(P)-dependent dehydrogenase (short-subunit alcohol dehydrogenase family)